MHPARAEAHLCMRRQEHRGVLALTPDELVLWYQCKRKRTYESWDEANAAGILAWQETYNTPNPPTPYKCGHCENYHVGRLGGVTKQKRRARRFYERGPKNADSGPDL